MFLILTKYLIQYKQVSIPSIGTFTIEAAPAQFNFGDKLIVPPTIKTVYSNTQDISSSQVIFLSGLLNKSTEEVQNNLHAFGNGLRSSLQQQPFSWNGFGTLDLKGSNVIFTPKPNTLLEPVPAQKAVREEALHKIRRGEEEVHSSFGEREQPIAKKNDLEWLAWLLVVLALLFILYCFYQQGFSLHATGKRTGAFEDLFQNK